MAEPKRSSRSRWAITAFGFAVGVNIVEMRKTAEAARAGGRVGLILVETPANPTIGLIDLTACGAIADELGKSQGTMLGPMFQTPLKCGADISLRSLTKYVGGHSDLVGGSISGDASLVKQVKSAVLSARSWTRILVGC
jgi:methionine-gamma-lyase